VIADVEQRLGRDLQPAFERPLVPVVVEIASCGGS
jgi:hypothetical protein